MRRSELDPVGARSEQRARVLDDARRLPRERKAVEQVVGDLTALGNSIVGSNAATTGRYNATSAARAPRARVVLVDDGDRADHELVSLPPSRSLTSRTMSGFAEPPIFSSSACPAANAVRRGDQVPTRSGT